MIAFLSDYTHVWINGEWAQVMAQNSPVNPTYLMVDDFRTVKWIEKTNKLVM